MSELEYGLGFCNPAYVGQEPVANWEYIATIPPSDPWKSVIDAGVKRLDEADPEWRIVQIKVKFGECRFYIAGNAEAQAIAREIERECDEADEAHIRKTVEEIENG